MPSHTRPVHVQVQAAPLVASCGTSLVPHLPVNPTSPRLPTAQFLLACRCRVRHLVPRACSKIWWHLCFCGARHGCVATVIVVWCGAGFLGAYMVPWCWHGSVVAGMVLLCRASLCAPRYGSVVASSICGGTHDFWCKAWFCSAGMVMWRKAWFCGAGHAFVVQGMLPWCRHVSVEKGVVWWCHTGHCGSSFQFVLQSCVCINTSKFFAHYFYALTMMATLVLGACHGSLQYI